MKKWLWSTRTALDMPPIVSIPPDSAVLEALPCKEMPVHRKDFPAAVVILIKLPLLAVVLSMITVWSVPVVADPAAVEEMAPAP